MHFNALVNFKESVSFSASVHFASQISVGGVANFAESVSFSVSAHFAGFVALTGGGSVASATLSVAAGMLTVGGEAVSGGSGIKAWAHVNKAGTLSGAANVAGVSVSSTSYYVVTFTTPLADNNYAAIATANSVSFDTSAAEAVITSKSTTGLTVRLSKLKHSNFGIENVQYATSFSLVVIK